MIKAIVRFFDKLEDKVRSRLSHYPLLYAIIGGIGVVLFWRGIWQISDDIPYLGGAVSAALGIGILAVTGVLVSSFIGNRILLTGLQGKKKLTEMDPKEIETEEMKIEKSQSEMRKEIAEIDEKVSEALKEIEGKINT